MVQSREEACKEGEREIEQSALRLFRDHGIGLTFISGIFHRVFLKLNREAKALWEAKERERAKSKPRPRPLDIDSP